MDIPKKARRCPHCRTKQGIGLGGLIIIIIFVGMVLSVVMGSLPSNTNTIPTDVGTYVAPPKADNFELGTYKVESTEFQYIDPKQVNLWKSFADRTLLGKVSEGDIVEVTKYDSTNNYCFITKADKSGWASCEWLIKVK